MSDEGLKAHVRCNKQLAVKDNGSGFVINEACPIGEGLGLPVVELLGKCKVCEHGKPQATEHSAAAAAGAAVADAVVAYVIANPLRLPLPGTQPVEKQNSDGSITSPMISIPLEAPVEPVAVPKPEDVPPLTIDKKADYASELMPLESVIMPSGITLGSVNSGLVDVGEILDTIEGCPHGSSTGGISPHKNMENTCKRRAYLDMVLGLQQLKKRRALEFGTLFHAVLAMRYLHGAERQWEPCEKVAQAGGADMAFECKQLLTVQFEKYQRKEWDTWCPRAIEYNMMAWLPVQHGAKKVQLPLSARIDLILALKKPNEPHPGPGPVPSGVYLVDWKTTSAITYDLLSGYGMDYQFLMQCAIFKLGNYHEVFGPLRGVMVGLAAKRRKNPSFDDFQRIESPMSDKTVTEFIEEELKPHTVELYTKLCDEEARADARQWPRDRRLCIGRWGPCNYFDYCDSGAVTEYRIDHSRIVNKDWFTAPPNGWAPEDGGEAMAVENKKKRQKSKSTASSVDSPETKTLAVSINSQIEATEGFEQLRKENFLSPGHTFVSVKQQLGAALKVFYESSAKEKVVFHMDGKEWKFQKTGCAWKGSDGTKGRVAWGAVAEWICRNVWFNLAAAQPE